MPGQELFGFDNLLDGATITPSSEDPLYPAENIADPESPGFPAKTVGLGAQDFLFDFGSTKDFNLVSVVRVNVQFVNVLAYATNPAGAPDYQDSFDLGVDRFTGSRRGGLEVGPRSFRYVRLQIPDQTPTDGASAYSVGGVGIYQAVAAPKNMRWGYVIKRIEPKEDIGPRHGGWSVRLKLGVPRIEIEGRRLGLLDQANLADADGLGAWADLDMQMWESSFFCFVLGQGNSAHTWIVKRVSDPTWAIDTPVAEDPVKYEEVLTP